MRRAERGVVQSNAVQSTVRYVTDPGVVYVASKPYNSRKQVCVCVCMYVHVNLSLSLSHTHIHSYHFLLETKEKGNPIPSCGRLDLSLYGR